MIRTSTPQRQYTTVTVELPARLHWDEYDPAWIALNQQNILRQIAATVGEAHKLTWWRVSGFRACWRVGEGAPTKATIALAGRVQAAVRKAICAALPAKYAKRMAERWKREDDVRHQRLARERARLRGAMAKMAKKAA